MNNDIKSGIGYIIPLSSTVAFFTCLALGEYLFSISIAIAGILVWFLYMLIMESSPPSNLGNLIMFFGVLLSIGIFMGFGISKNMLPNIFDPFVSTKSDGKGLGLSIVASGLQEMNAVINVTSEPGLTNFCINFPLKY